MWLVIDSFPFIKNNVTCVNYCIIEIILIINSNFGPWRLYSCFLNLKKIVEIRHSSSFSNPSILRTREV